MAIDRDRAVLRVDVVYLAPRHQEYADLWVLRFAADGRGRGHRGMAILAGQALHGSGRLEANACPGLDPARPVTLRTTSSGTGTLVSSGKGPIGKIEDAEDQLQRIVRRLIDGVDHDVVDEEVNPTRSPVHRIAMVRRHVNGTRPHRELLTEVRVAKSVHPRSERGQAAAREFTATASPKTSTMQISTAPIGLVFQTDHPG